MNFAWIVILFLVLSVACNGFFVLQQSLIYQDLETWKQRSAAMPPPTQMQLMTQSMMNELMIYGQREPAIIPILARYGMPMPSAKTPPPPPPR